MAQPTPATRHFLGWSSPILPAAAAHLVRHTADLPNVVVVTPGARAGRILADLVSGLGGAPPRSLTPGQAIDALVRLPATAAGPLPRRLAWIDALRATPAGALSPLAPRRPRDLAGWSALAATLEQAHAELAAQRLLFADVPERAAGLPDFADAERWAAAAEVQRRYGEVLEAQGLVDADLWRRKTLDDPAFIPPSTPIVLVAVTELGAAARAVLHRSGARVSALIGAPPDLSDGFDDLGCIIPERWSDRSIPLADERIIFADSPAEQAGHALATLAVLEGRYRADQIVIATPDPDVVAHLERRAAASSLSVRNAAGRPLSRTAPYRLLEAVAEHVERRCFRTLAALVRHPDAEQYLLATLTPPAGATGCEWWLAEMDEYAAASLHDPLDGSWCTSRPELLDTLRRVNDGIDAALGELSRGAPGPLAGWAAPIAGALSRIYGTSTARDHGQAAHAVMAELVASVGAIPATPGAAPVSAAEAIRIILSGAANLSIPPPVDPGAVELLGWLELPLDPAPVAVITGMNEGHIPARPAAGPLLPDRLRQTLGLSCDQRLHARDAYLLSAIVAGRPTTTIICGRRGNDGDPLTPSRLLFACDGPLLVRRVLRFAGGQSAAPLRLVDPVQPGPSSRFFPRPVRDSQPIRSLPVTAFATYIASPYLFYLRHIASLAPVEPDAAELDAAAYGRLIHEVLEAFGKGPERHSDDPERVEQFLNDGLSSLALRRFGPHPCAAVQIQLALIRCRLRNFARVQGAHRRTGWLIERIEWSPRHAPLDVDGDPFGLSGRIDRIDRHEHDGRVILIDYKTGDSLRDPVRSHRGPDGWKDLQLPLYRHLAAACGFFFDPDRLAFAYFALPRRASEVCIMQAAWSRDELDSADDAAREVIRKVRRREFSELGARTRAGGVMGALCGLGLLGEPPGDDDEGGEGGDE